MGFADEPFLGEGKMKEEGAGEETYIGQSLPPSATQARNMNRRGSVWLSQP